MIRIRILQVNSSYLGGAAGNFDLMCQELSKDDNVYIFSAHENHSESIYSVRDSIINENMPHRSLNLFGAYNRGKVINYCHPQFEKHFKNFIEMVKPEMVHFHVIEALGASLISTAKELGLPVIVTMHDWWWVCFRGSLVDKKWQVCSQTNGIFPEKCYCLKNKKFFIQRWSYLKSILDLIDIIIVPSLFIKNSLIKKCGLSEYNIAVVANGILKKDERHNKARAERIRFGFVGGSDPAKGGHVLLKAFHQIKTGRSELQLYGFKKLQGINYDTTNKLQRLLYVLKRIASDPFRIWQKIVIYLKYINCYPSTKYVKLRFLPPYRSDQIDDIYSRMDVLIIPSIMRESFSLVAREALYRNVPVICSDCGGPEEIVEDGVNGFIFKTNDVDDLAQKILQILKHPALIDEFIYNIDKTKIISIQDQAELIKQVYRDILS